MLNAMFENQGILTDVDQDWPKNVPKEMKQRRLFEDGLNTSSTLNRPGVHYQSISENGCSTLSGELMPQKQVQNAWLVNLMGMVNTPSIKGRTAKEVIR